MKDYHYETITETKQKQIGHTTVCNRCGKKNHIQEGKNHDFEDDTQSIYLDFGYESKFDGEKWSFDLCDNCLEAIVKDFKYVPDGFKQDDYMLLDNEEHQRVFENWKETGEWEDLKFKTYEELKEMNNGWFNYEYINDAVKKYHPDKPELERVNEEE